jgi:hypothetical protein
MSAKDRPFTAAMARATTDKSLRGEAIKPWADYILSVIKLEAVENYSLNHPFADRRGDVGSSPPDYPSSELQRAIKRYFEKLGYSWVEHPDPDPGHPGSGPYIEITWQFAKP